MSIHVHGVKRAAESLVGGRGRGDGSHLLATVMGLPLIDGVFPAVVLAGGLGSPLGVLQTGLLVLGGAATASVLVSSDDIGASEVLAVGAGVSVVAGIEAALAPTFESLVSRQIFDVFAVATVLTVAVSVATDVLDDVLPKPRTVVAAGLVVSLDPSGFELVVHDLSLVVKGVLAGGVATVFGLCVVAARSRFWGSNSEAGLRLIDARLLRLTSGASLGTLPLSVYGVVPEAAPISVLAVGVVLAAAPCLVQGGDENRQRMTWF
ncbi:DUF5794 domain-containing protein [Halorutilales archaeon Cl-col2-1]